MSMQAWSWWSRPRAVAIGGRTFVQVEDEATVTVLVYTGQNTTPVKKVVAAIQRDDHNNGAIVIAPGKPAVSIYSNHATDYILRVKRSIIPIESGVDYTGAAETQITCLLPPTYAVATPHGTDEIFCMFRTTGTTGSEVDPWTWSYIRSTDWGVTWSPPVTLFSHPFQFYGGAVRYGLHTWRVTMSTHPVSAPLDDQTVYYCEINLATGAVTKSDGTLLGNLDGTSLPILMTDLEPAGVPLEGRASWTWDISDAAEPEITWGSYEPPIPNIDASGSFHYTRRVQGQWYTYEICDSGTDFTDGDQAYQGGAQMPVGSPGGVVYVAREEGDKWWVERLETPNKGATFSTTIVAQSTGTDRLCRAWPVDNRDATASFELMANLITSWTAYTVQSGSITPRAAVDGGWIPIVAERYTGSAWERVGIEEFGVGGWVGAIAERHVEAADQFGEGANGWSYTTVRKGYASSSRAGRDSARSTREQKNAARSVLV